MRVRGAERVVVVGYGSAGHRLVDRLAHHGYRGEVTVLGAEATPAYQRTLLTSVLDGTLSAEALRLPAPSSAVCLRLGVEATAIDRKERLVHGSDGTSYPYDRLVLATGAAPLVPALPWPRAGNGHIRPGVRVLRTLSDCAGLSTAESVAIVGGGPLAVEVALALGRRRREVTVVHRGPHLLDRHLDARAGELLSDRLRALEIGVCLGRTTEAYEDGKLRLDDGRWVASENVLLATGVTPSVDLARAARLAVRGGVLVDDELRTDDPRIHAIGDCARPVGSVAMPPCGHAAASEQADVVAELLVEGGSRYTPARSVSRLRDRGLDMMWVGSLEAAEETVALSDPARGRYARLGLRAGRIAGAVQMGTGRAIAAVARLYQRDEPVPTDRLALLLGARPEYAEGPGPAAGAVLCHCNNVTRNDLDTAWQEGARTVDDLVAATRVTTGCGGCADSLREWCSQLPLPRSEDAG